MYMIGRCDGAETNSNDSKKKIGLLILFLFMSDVEASARRGIIAYIEYQSVCSFVGFGSPPPTASVSPPLDPKVGKQHSLAGEGIWRPNSDDWTESLALCILCVSQIKRETKMGM